MEVVDIIGFFAGTIFASSGLAQAFKIYRMKGGDSISLLNYAMMITGMGLWTLYSAILGAWMFVIWNSAAIAIQLIVLILTLYYSRKKFYKNIEYDRRKSRA